MAFLLLNIFSFLCVSVGLVIIGHAAVETALKPSEIYGKGKPLSFGTSKEVTIEFRYQKPRALSTEQVDLDHAHFGDNKKVGDTFIKYDKNSKPLQDPSFKATASALFFLEKNMHKGSQMKLFFTKSTTPLATFLPCDLAKQISFSSNKFTEILKYFSLKPSSKEAKMMKRTIDVCEATAMKGEEKQFASSLESMIDFTTSKLGTRVQAISMEANRESDKMQEYTIVGVKKMGDGKSISCHKQNFAYAVFYCHSTFGMEAYRITLMGKNGARAKAVGVCHTDTKDWDADYIAFEVLNVKPGTVPICHRLPQESKIMLFGFLISWFPFKSLINILYLLSLFH